MSNLHFIIKLLNSCLTLIQVFNKHNVKLRLFHAFAPRLIHIMHIELLQKVIARKQEFQKQLKV